MCPSVHLSRCPSGAGQDPAVMALKPLAQISETVLFDGFGSSLVQPPTAGCKADDFSFRSISKFPYLCGGHSLPHKDFVGTESFIYFVKKKYRCAVLKYAGLK